ncbi:ArpU family phage packaging/lysis transcriptional regulator [Levilactobacillus yiduensis]|uniref:ArpU family phage packaging/lysis transcriptional regulator n=1 Tax=Levilactobacillus yiduensis TaxID=2953880 RepID=UPI001FD65029|nr:ArpU family phage packaging/lysis transcriptional regulator [Levilactobacillus yiduensis]
MADIDFKNVSMSEIFPEVDEKKARQKVASFLSRALPRMIRITSNSLTELRSQRLNDMPKASDSDNDSDRRIVQHLYAEQVVQQVKQAISQCNQESQNILNMLYFKNYF